MTEGLKARAIAVAVCVVIVLTGVVSIGVWTVIRRLEIETADRLVEAAARLAAENPELAGPLASALVAYDPAGQEQGRELLARYGFDPETAVLLHPSRRTWLAPVLVAATGVFVSGALLTLLLLISLNRIYTGLDELTLTAERIATGRYRLDPSGEKAGSLGRLEHQIVKTAHRFDSQVELIKSEREKLKEFLSDVSHQLKTPVASIRMFLELLISLTEQEDHEASTKGLEYRSRNGSGTPDRRGEFLTRSLSKVDRIEWLIKNLLILARLESESLPMQVETESLVRTVGIVVDHFRPQAEESGIELRFDAGDSVAVTDLPHDPRWLGEAVSNLVKNAVEHTPSGGIVDVTLQWTDLFVRIGVRDSGEGIPVEDLPHIFRRFYRGRNRERRRTLAYPDYSDRRTGSGGTGIGLALAKAITERHHGFIGVESPSTGGAVFYVTLPLELTKL